MAASIVAKDFAGLFMLFVLLVCATAQNVTAINDTVAAPEINPSLALRLIGGPLFDGKAYTVTPLTAGAGRDQSAVAISTYNIAGNFRLVDSTSMNITVDEIPFICCDPNPTSAEASAIVAVAAAERPRAIVLYSAEDGACSVSGDFDFQSIYSMTRLRDSQELMKIAALYPPSTTLLRAVISPNSTTANAASNQQSGTNNEGGPAPTTAVAMSILYSITGIITLLFLIIIATGAIRAHRHPERYGPRNGLPGRPRQSRAKGLARAMLDTLPIVKFGDPEPTKQVSIDVELENGREPHTTHEGTQKMDAVPDEDGKLVTSALRAAQPGSIRSDAEVTGTQENGLGCSICTEDFTTGEDVRVLPCDHKYHPACIDPWLLNVSGTCPLCRHDLRPLTPGSSVVNNTITAEGRELPPPLTVDNENTSDEELSGPHRNRISRFLDLNRLRHAPPDERIAALRQLREQEQANAAVSGIVDRDEGGRRAWLTSRLRDTLSVRTRTQNVAQGTSEIR